MLPSFALSAARIVPGILLVHFLLSLLMPLDRLVFGIPNNLLIKEKLNISNDRTEPKI